MQATRDAIEILKAEHKRIDELLIAAQRQGAVPAARVEVMLEIRNAILQHLDLEERTFYPVCSRYSELRELIEQSLDEHQQIKDLLYEMSGERSVDELDSLFDQLVAFVESHIDEEETEVFRIACDVIDEARLKEIGEQLSKSAA